MNEDKEKLINDIIKAFEEHKAGKYSKTWTLGSIYIWLEEYKNK